MTIKKTFVELVEFLETNKNKKVSTLLPEIYEMTKQKANAKTFLTNENNEVYAIYCYYHKQWELLEEVPYGKKASSTTGFNTMCKAGVSAWTRQNRKIKQVGDEVLDLLERGEIEADAINETKEKLLEKAREIDTTDMPVGYTTPEEAEEAYNNLK